jgi:hypothetical protein
MNLRSSPFDPSSRSPGRPAGRLRRHAAPAPAPDLVITRPVLSSFYTDTNGNPIVCDDATTPLSFEFLYSGDLQRIEVSLVGVTTGASRAPQVTDSSFTNGNGVVRFVVPVRSAPLRAGPQAIIVVPTSSAIRRSSCAASAAPADGDPEQQRSAGRGQLCQRYAGAIGAARSTSSSRSISASVL